MWAGADVGATHAEASQRPQAEPCACPGLFPWGAQPWLASLPLPSRPLPPAWAPGAPSAPRPPAGRCCGCLRPLVSSLTTPTRSLRRSSWSEWVAWGRTAGDRRLGRLAAALVLPSSLPTGCTARWQPSTPAQPSNAGSMWAGRGLGCRLTAPTPSPHPRGIGGSAPLGGQGHASTPAAARRKLPPPPAAAARRRRPHPFGVFCLSWLQVR